MASKKKDELADILVGQQKARKQELIVYKYKKKKTHTGKYSPEYCDMLIHHMGRGYDFETFTVEVGVATSTIYLWLKEHPEFSSAYDQARAAHRMFYQNLIIRNAKYNKGNSASSIFLAKNKLGYTDKTEIDMSQQTLVVTAKIGDDGQIIKNVTAQSEINAFLSDVINEGFNNESIPEPTKAPQ